MAINYFKGKDLDGTFNHGEGPVMGIEIDNQSENPGLLTGGEGGGKNLNSMSGKTPPANPATPGGDNLFSLRGSSYTGPQNFVPNNIGVTNPFDINKG